MTDTPTKVIIDCSTGEQAIVPLTAEEIAQLEADRLVWEQEEAQRAAELAAKEAAKQSAVDKLKAIGLSDVEIAALTGN